MFLFCKNTTPKRRDQFLKDFKYLWRVESSANFNLQFIYIEAESYWIGFKKSWIASQILRRDSVHIMKIVR